MERMISLLGLFVMVGVAYLLSSDKKAIRWKTIIIGVSLQIFFGLIILKTPFGKTVFEQARSMFVNILGYTQEGSNFIFGQLANPTNVGFVFATMVLPTIIFMSALMSVLYHLGVMQKVVE